MEKLDRDSMLSLANTCTSFQGLLENPRLWIDIDTEIECPRDNLMQFFVKYTSWVKRLKCKFKHELLYSAKLNEIIPSMHNLVSLNLKSCSVFYSAYVLGYTPNLVYLNVSDCPWLSTTSLVTNMQFIPNLKFFWCDNNSAHHSAYSIYQCITETPKLEVLSCKESGFMAPLIVNSMLCKCPNIQQFFFTSNERYESDTTKLQWYNLVRKKYSHVEFSDETNDKIERSIRECSIVQLQMHHDWAMQEQ